MFALVANGMKTTCKTQRELGTLLAIYPYAKFKQVADMEAARWWFSQNPRYNTDMRFTKYGNTSASGYASIEYFIVDNNLYYNVRTNKLGFIRVDKAEDMIIDSRRDLLKIKVINTPLDQNLIMHHCIAIRRILKILGDYIDVDIIVPDISIYLAVTKYTGKNYMIKGLQHDIAKRLGGVSMTVRSI